MAFCSYSALFESLSSCGSSSNDAQDVQCVVISECNRDVFSHLKSLKSGPDEAICNEYALLLARAGNISDLFHKIAILYFMGRSQFYLFYKWIFTSGMFKVEDQHLSMIICPHHREKFGLRWRSGTVRCGVPNQFAGHKSLTAKGDRGMKSRGISFYLHGNWGTLSCWNS